MKIKNLLMSALMLLCGAQAFAQDAEVVLYPADGTPADGQVIEGTNVSFKLGNDGKWKAPQFINAGTANAVLQGIGNYQGSRTVQFKILPLIGMIA